MPERPNRITLEQIAEVYKIVPAPLQAAQGWDHLTVAVQILCHFLGKEWCKKQMKTQDYFGINYWGKDYDPNSIGPLPMQMGATNLLQLAEAIFNLQHIPGFHSCLDRMRTGKKSQLEATYAEIAFARGLFFFEVDFEFNESVRAKHRDYDFIIRYPDGRKVCADAKNRSETGDFNPELLTNAWGKSVKKQLPPLEPSIIFHKVPDDWIMVQERVERLRQVAVNFLQHTRRVVSIKFYTEYPLFYQTGMSVGYASNEVNNERNKFDPGRNWDLFNRACPFRWTSIYSQVPGHG